MSSRPSWLFSDPTPNMKPIEDAPTHTDLCVFVQDAFGLYQLPFPCRLDGRGLKNAQTGEVLHATPIGWKPWEQRNRRVGLRLRR